MDGKDYYRGRSPSTGNAHGIKQSPSPSPHNQAFTSHANAFAIDPTLSGQTNAYSSASPFDTQASTGLQPNSDSYLNQPQHHSYAFPGSQNQGLQQPAPQRNQQQFNVAGQSAFISSQDNSFPFDTTGSLDPQLIQSFDSQAGSDFDPQSFLDPSLIDPQSNPSHLEDETNLFADIGGMHQQTTEAPHLIHQDSQTSQHSQHSQNLSPQTSPGMQQGGFYQPQHARNSSLDPSSAAYPNNHGQWGGIQFQGHRRTPSDQYSDVSSQQASPYLGNSDSFEPGGNPSPLLNGQQDPAMNPDALGLTGFSLNDSSQAHISPGHSSHPSPSLGAQQAHLVNFPNTEEFSIHPGFGMQQNMPILPSQNESFPSISQPGEQMSPPEITVDYAGPPSKQSTMNFGDGLTGLEDSLSPPERRPRAVSAPHSRDSSRGPTPRSRSPSVGHGPGSNRSNSLSPTNRPRSPSAPIGIVKSQSPRRSPSPSLREERDRILDIAEQRPTSPSGQSASSIQGGSSPGHSDVSNSASKRVQKHPATFQCHLCPKRFTRAYNLRSHLRTHTDERPFVCTVCGKAFARQHDRKRHEGLHSGEKRFVCHGLLASSMNANGQQATWGCGRKFARADALGRHFRSEAGRACIKPLLDEEARERQAAMIDQQQQEMLNAQHQGGMPAPMAAMSAQPDPQIDYTAYPLPAALLQQYPALASVWDNMQGQMGQDFEGAGAGDDGDFEFNDGEYDDGGYVSGPGMDTSYPAAGSWNGGLGAHNGNWGSGALSDYEGGR